MKTRVPVWELVIKFGLWCNYAVISCEGSYWALHRRGLAAAAQGICEQTPRWIKRNTWSTSRQCCISGLKHTCKAIQGIWNKYSPIHDTQQMTFIPNSKACCYSPLILVSSTINRFIPIKSYPQPTKLGRLLKGLIQDACCFPVDSSPAIMIEIADSSTDSSSLMRSVSQ